MKRDRGPKFATRKPGQAEVMTVMYYRRLNRKCLNTEYTEAMEDSASSGTDGVPRAASRSTQGSIDSKRTMRHAGFFGYNFQIRWTGKS